MYPVIMRISEPMCAGSTVPGGVAFPEHVMIESPLATAPPQILAAVGKKHSFHFIISFHEEIVARPREARGARRGPISAISTT
jgi:hypothetical protein